MKILKVLMVLLSIITFATKVAIAASTKGSQAPTAPTVGAPTNTGGAAGVTKTVKEKLDGMKVTEAELKKYAMNGKVSAQKVKNLAELGVSTDDYEDYLLSKLEADLNQTCFICAEKRKSLNEKKKGAKAGAGEKVSSTAKVKLSEYFKHSGRYDFLRFGLGGRLLNSYTQDMQPGFNMSTSDSGLDLEWMAELKVWKIGLEYRPGHTVETETKIYGSSLGKEKLITELILIPKFYVVDKDDWDASLGLGMEQVRIEGALSMGGFKFRNDVTSMSYFVQLAGEYHLTSWASLRGAWEIGGPKMTNYIPGVPDQTLQGTGRVLGMAVVGY